ncbi:single-stranded DNA-binding protein [Clostridium luticellarii]|uniref:Single-stranded DNA-binding protein n=1 Tax=Clostridium luticellarii TaxID=1691940 RepID=A0A2T0B3V9_9CLOT|nr:single-stranded DNA-binding protein [Clostridium luticellarii]MCI1945865.1 single-stranded DNA-binding protein [Clostridium luticellarii]MCI1969197.1 single-stranded DNA-binding protein [Clostridium luticellarii]MCI1996159.1 single-stranded DNA-binding protein [Clostridium luticellarii]MCI2040508.1 single-stranded DNA-binding protein [Clostridium luticellarii]PRR78581.1 Single-stranded DNA-binding protein ssb [Clostridium luticellarii]
MNKVVLIGRLTKDPELRFTPGMGKAVTTFTIAVDRRFSKDGQREADFIPIVVWGKQAESTANYMSKGKLIGVSGRIQTRNYEAKDGSRRYVTEVIAEEVQFLEWGEKTSSNFNNENPSGNSNKSKGFDEEIYGEDITPVDDGDIPF